MFDTARFLMENFESAGKLAAMLRAYGISEIPKEDTIYAWFRRGSVPGQMLGTLIGVAELEAGICGLAARYIGGEYARQNENA